MFPLVPHRISFRRTLSAFALLASSVCLAVADDVPDSRKLHGLDYELLWVEPGSFVMGSAPDEALRDPAEGPQTKVIVSRGFWLGRTEVTQSVYEAVMSHNPSRFQEVGPQAPVDRVSWTAAMAFCERLTERERKAGRLPDGFIYTLPTEAQWEYAYRAGTTGSYPGDPAAMAWFEENSGGRTHVVAQLAPNGWGFYDMGGNVLEWCLDWYGPYPGGEVTDPSGPRRGYFRMARGGSWRTDIGILRSAARAGGSADREDYTLGFRIALSPSPAK